jgi:type II secretory pathway component PulJ
LKKRASEHFVRPRGDESGFSLVEVLVYIALGSVILAMLTSMLMAVFATRESVFWSSDMASKSQAASELFRSSIRSSVEVSLQSDNPPSGPQLLVVRKLENSSAVSLTPSSSCVAMLWQPASGDQKGALYFSTFSAAAQMPSPTATAGWVLLVDELEPLAGGQALFTQIENSYSLSFVTGRTNGPITTIKVSATAPVLDEPAQGQGLCF